MVLLLVVGIPMVALGVGLLVRRLNAYLTYEHAEGEVIEHVTSKMDHDRSAGLPKIRFRAHEDETIEFVSTAGDHPVGSRADHCLLHRVGRVGAWDIAMPRVRRNAPPQ